MMFDILFMLICFLFVVLVFLPGSEDIDNAVHLLEDRIDSEVEYHRDQSSNKRSRGSSHLTSLFPLALYSSLPAAMQMKVFDKTPPGYRKVIFSTNIAETSLTIDGICFVVDCGFVKTTYFDPRTGVASLITCTVPKSTSRQRAGRAGRTKEGKCFRLMTEVDFNALPDYAPPEMQRSDISGAMLQLKALGIHDVVHFDFLSPPPVENMIYALELLFSLGAVDESGSITALGEKIVQIPLEPQLAKCLISSFEFGCTEEMLSIAAMCSVDFPFAIPRGRVSAEQRQHYSDCVSEFAVLEGDHLFLLNIFNKFLENESDAKSWCDSYRLQYKILVRAKELRQNLKRMLVSLMSENSVLSSCGEDSVSIRKCIVSGYFGNAARLTPSGNYVTVRGQQLVAIHSNSVLSRFGAPAEWVVFNDVVFTTNAQIRDVSKIEPLWLLELASSYYISAFPSKI